LEFEDICNLLWVLTLSSIAGAEFLSRDAIGIRSPQSQHRDGWLKHIDLTENDFGRLAAIRPALR
jgi:hypothetical protein